MDAKFATSPRYPGDHFVESAWVSTPKPTTIGAPRELARIPFEKVLPHSLYWRFAASFELIFTRNDEADVPVVRGSAFSGLIDVI